MNYKLLVLLLLFCICRADSQKIEEKYPFIYEMVNSKNGVLQMFMKDTVIKEALNDKLVLNPPIGYVFQEENDEHILWKGTAKETWLITDKEGKSISKLEHFSSIKLLKGMIIAAMNFHDKQSWQAYLKDRDKSFEIPALAPSYRSSYFKKIGIFDIKGNVILDLEYDIAYRKSSSEQVAILQKNRQGFFLFNGDKVGVSLIGGSVLMGDYAPLTVQKNAFAFENRKTKKYYVYDYEMKRILERDIIQDKQRYLLEGNFIIKRIKSTDPKTDWYFELLNLKGETISPHRIRGYHILNDDYCRTREFILIDNPLREIRHNGLLNIYGKYILQPEYREIRPIANTKESYSVQKFRLDEDKRIKGEIYGVVTPDKGMIELEAEDKILFKMEDYWIGNNNNALLIYDDDFKTRKVFRNLINPSYLGNGLIKLRKREGTGWRNWKWGVISIK